MKPTPDDRAPLARAYDRATRGMAIALGMVVPGLVGYYVDTRLGTRALLTILGFALGMTYGIWELVRMGRRRPQDRDDVDRS